MQLSWVSNRLGKVGAVIKDSHLVYASGRHGSAYVNKDALYPHTELTCALCFEIYSLVNEIVFPWPDVIVAPAVGGVILSQWVAYSFSKAKPYIKTLALYADKNSDGSFSLKRGYDKLASGKRVLVVEDVLNTGGSAAKTIEAVRKVGGKVVAVAALCNRGGVTAKELDVPDLVSLIDLNLDSWAEEDCPLCLQGVPINTSVGHGAEFLARKK